MVMVVSTYSYTTNTGVSCLHNSMNTGETIMSNRNYRQDYADTDLPLDVLRDDDGAYRAPADWISLPNGTAGDSVDITTFHGNVERTYTVGADGVTAWMVDGQGRSVDDVKVAGIDAVSIVTGDLVAFSV